MARNSRIYGLTLKQWTTIIATLLVGTVLLCGVLYRTAKNWFYAPSDPTQSTSQKPSRHSGTLQPATIEEASALYLALGNPSNANQSDAKNYLLINQQYALSYNREKGTPNWVSWHVDAGDLTGVDRQNNFRPDDRLPADFPHVTPNDYTGSGFDRGHVCPSADRASSPEANSATFLMTNMTPQTPDLNRNVWEHLESYSRELVKQGSEVYIIAGVYGENGKLKRKVTVPTNDWKVVVVLPNGSDASEISNQTRVIAVDMPNTSGIANDDWRKYRVTVRQIEQKTGLNLLSNLPQNVQDALETKIDNK